MGLGFPRPFPHPCAPDEQPMSSGSLEAALPEGERLLLDTTSLIAYLDGGEAVSPVATHIIDAFVRSGRNEAIVSMVTVMEILVKPLRLGPRAPYQHVLDFLTRYPHLRTLVIDLPVAQEAASLRASFGLRPPDALIVASGLISQVGYLVTNDAQWSSKLRPLSGRVGICQLSSHLPFP